MKKTYNFYSEREEVLFFITAESSHLRGNLDGKTLQYVSPKLPC